MGYLDLSASAKRQLLERLKYRVEAVATGLRDEIVSQMDPGPPRTGATYPMPDSEGTYTASAPGEPPAVRTAEYRDSWQVTPPVVVGERVVAAAVSAKQTEDGKHWLGEVLEYGTSDGRIQPRPHIGPALENVAQRWGGRVAR